MCLFIEALAFGQGFNRRYDLLDKDLAQGAWGIEYNNTGTVVFSGSWDYDSIAPDTFFFHASVVLTYIDETGDVIWEKRNFREQHSAFAGWANCCDSVPSGGWVVGGSSESTDGLDEIYLQRFDENGDTLWTKVFGDPNEYWGGRQVKSTSDGGFLIVGDTDTNGSTDAFVLKTDSFGNEEWRETYGGGALLDGFVACEEVPNGYILGGLKFIGANNSQFWVLRIDSVGDPIWSKLWGGPFEEANAHLVKLQDGHILVASSWGYAINFGNSVPYLAKLDSADGSIIWEREYGGPYFVTSLFAVKECTNNDLISCGVSYAIGEQQGLLLRTNSLGDSIWMRTYFYADTLFNDGQGRFYDVLPTQDGGFIATGVVDLQQKSGQ